MVRSEQLATSDVRLNGTDGSLHMDEKGDLVWLPLKVTRSLFCLKKPSTQVIKASELLGATLEPQNAVRFWYCHPTKGSQGESEKAEQAAAQSPGTPSGSTGIGMVPAAPKMVYTLKKSGKFQCNSNDAAEKLVEQIRRNSSWWGRPSPPSIVAIVNPKSGRGRSTRILNQTLLPILRDAAGMNVRVHETKGPGDATAIVQALDLSAVDMLLCVGGDGTMYEGVQGMLGRQDWAAACQLPIAAVPTGSGNGLAASTGMWDPTTAAFAICKGRTEPMDMVSVLQPPGSRFLIFLSVVFGLMANLDIGTECMRWMGEPRFTLGGVKELILAKKYPARIAYLPQCNINAVGSTPGAAAAMQTITQSHPTIEPAASASAATFTGTAGSTACMREALLANPTSRGSDQIPRAAAAGGSGAAKQLGSMMHAMAGGFRISNFPTGPPLPLLSQFPDDMLPTTLNEPGASQQLPAGWAMLPDEELQFFGLYNPQYVALSTRLNPQGILNSGSWDLMHVSGLKGLSGRLKFADMLLRVDDGSHVQLEHVKTEKVCAMMIQPLCSNTYMVLDGEQVPISPLWLEVHPGLCNVAVAPDFYETKRPSVYSTL